MAQASRGGAGRGKGDGDSLMRWRLPGLLFSDDRQLADTIGLEQKRERIGEREGGGASLCADGGQFRREHDPLANFSLAAWNHPNVFASPEDVWR